MICWWGRVDTESDDWFQQCAYVPAFGPGYLQFPWCPGSTYRKRYYAFKVSETDEPCDCIDPSGAEVEWEPEGGPWGQWRVTLGNCDGRVTMLIRPTGLTGGGGVEWEYEIEWEGNVLEDSGFWACSQFPFQYAIDFWNRGPCPESWVLIEFREDP